MKKGTKRKLLDSDETGSDSELTGVAIVEDFSVFCEIDRENNIHCSHS